MRCCNITSSTNKIIKKFLCIWQQQMYETKTITFYAVILCTSKWPLLSIFLCSSVFVCNFCYNKKNTQQHEIVQNYNINTNYFRGEWKKTTLTPTTNTKYVAMVLIKEFVHMKLINNRLWVSEWPTSCKQQTSKHSWH